jgi:hypothetical protein
MKHSDVMRWLYSEIDSVLDSSTLVSFSDRDDHIGLARGREEYPYPFVAIDHNDGNPRSAGIGAGTAFVDELIFDNNDVLTEIIYRRDTVLDVTIQTLTDGDRELRDDLAQEIQGHFALVSRQGEYHGDMNRLEVGTATPNSRPDTFVYGDGTDMRVDYSAFISDPDPDAAEQIDITLKAAEDTDGTDGDSEDYTITP